MEIIEIAQDVNDRLEEMSIEQNKSKGAIAVELVEVFLPKGVPHQRRKLTDGAAA